MVGIFRTVGFAVLVTICLFAGLMLGFGIARAVVAAEVHFDDAASQTRDASTDEDGSVKNAEDQGTEDQTAEDQTNELPEVVVDDPSAWFSELDDPVGAVKQYLSEIKTLRADFVQRGPDGRTARGTMTLARPGKARFQYEPSVPILVVSDGKNLSFIDYDVPQVTRWPVKETPLALLLDPEGAIDGKLRVVEAGPGPIAGTISIVAKDPDHKEYGVINLIFDTVGPGVTSSDADRLALRAWQIIDARGEVTTVTLDRLETGVEVDKSTFRYEDPRPKSLRRRN